MSRPSLGTIVRRALAPGGAVALPRGATLLVAVSGGPDSMALLDVCARVAPTFGLRVVAHGVDHGLREAASAELDLAEDLATSLGVPFARSRVRVVPGGNLQARARAARYEALAHAASSAGAAHVATAHHADDRAETVLLRMLRGAGARGLAVLPARAPWPDGDTPLELVRPLLGARREDVLAHLARRAIRFAQDPSNTDPRYGRARVRGEVLPLLASLDARIVDHLNRLADELAAVGVPADPLGLPRAAQDALARMLRDPAIDGEVWLPGGLTVRRARHEAGADLRPGASRRAPRRPRAAGATLAPHVPHAAAVRNTSVTEEMPSRRAKTSAGVDGAPYCSFAEQVRVRPSRSQREAPPGSSEGIPSSLGGIQRSSLRGPRSS